MTCGSCCERKQAATWRAAAAVREKDSDITAAFINEMAAHWGHHLVSRNKINAKEGNVEDITFTSAMIDAASASERSEYENSINNRWQ